MSEELEKLRADNARLRAALEQIRTLDHGNDWDKESSSVIAHMATIATVALSEE